MIQLSEEHKPLSAKLIRNVAYGGLRALLVIPIPFVLTPLILRKLGTRGYGTWAIFMAMNALTSLADLGLLGTLSKYIAEYYAQRDFERINRLLNTGVLVFSLLASALVIGLWAASPILIRLLFVDSQTQYLELRYLFKWELVLIWLNVITFLASSVASGLQRLDLSNLLTAFSSVTAAMAGAVLLVAGRGLRGLIYGSVGAAAITLIFYLSLVRRILPQYRLNLRDADSREARNIFSFSLQLYVVQVAFAIHNQTEKLFLAVFNGVVPVGWYDMAGDLATKVRGACGLLLSPVLPAASELNALGQAGRVKELFFRSSKYFAFVAVPLTTFGAVAAPRFVDLWIGTNLHVVAFPLSALLVVNFINLSTSPGYFVLVGQGCIGPGIYSSLTGIGLNIPLSLMLIYRFGFKGAVVGTALSLVAAAILFTFLFHRQTGYSFVQLMREAYLKPSCCSVVLAIGISVLGKSVHNSWLTLGAAAFFFAVLYVAILIFSSFFDSSDWERIDRILPLARVARKVCLVA